jgi:organic radical activating enzyme
MTLIGYMSNFQNIPWNDITQLGQKTLLDTDLFTVSWILARFCNYNCSYCWPYARSSTPDHQTLETYKNVLDEIKRQARANGFTDFHFSFSGGEPTAYKYFGELIEHYCSDTAPEYQSIHMTTNLSPGSKWWNKWLEATSTLQRRSITASYHAEFANEQEFGDKCLQLMKGGTFVTINQVMVPQMFDELYERLERFADRGINVTLKPQSDPTASFVVSGYTPEQIHKMQTGFPQRIPDTYRTLIPLYQVELKDKTGNTYNLDQAERLNAFGFNKFKGWTCNAGYQGIVIREDEVRRSYSCHDEPLGTLTDGFEIFKEPQMCVTPTCVSSADSKLPKVKNV